MINPMHSTDRRICCDGDCNQGRECPLIAEPPEPEISHEEDSMFFETLLIALIGVVTLFALATGIF